MTSPLGKYSQIVAAVTAVGVIFAYLLGVLSNIPNADTIKDFALIALGAVFGSSAATNGWKAAVIDQRNQLAAVHKRLDQAGYPAAKQDLKDTVITDNGHSS